MDFLTFSALIKTLKFNYLLLLQLPNPGYNVLTIRFEEPRKVYVFVNRLAIWICHVLRILPEELT